MAITIHGDAMRGADGLSTIMNRHQTEMGKSIERISTGLKINHAGDDSAGHAISEKMKTQIRALDQSEENAQSAGALLGVAETSLTSILDVITEMHTKAAVAMGTQNEDDRAVLQNEINLLKDEVLLEAQVKQGDRHLFSGNFGAVLEEINNVSTYIGDYESNGRSIGYDDELHISAMKWTEGKSGEQKPMYFQVGPESGDSITVHLMDMNKIFDGLTLDVSTQDAAKNTMKSLDDVMKRVMFQLTEVASVQERLEFTTSNLRTVSENTNAALDTIQDADMAKEMTTFVKNNVLLQATQAMMAQANSTLESFVSLLQPVS